MARARAQPRLLRARDASLGGDDGIPRAQPAGYRARRQPDGVARPWWTVDGRRGTANRNSTEPVSAASSASERLERLDRRDSHRARQPAAAARRLVSNSESDPNSLAAATVRGTGAQQRFENVDVSSTGDPHLAAVGTREGRGRWSCDRRALGQHDVAERPRTQHADRRRLPRLHGGHATRRERRRRGTSPRRCMRTSTRTR